MRYEVRDIDQSAEITALQDNIVKLEAERDKLRAALEPFARGATALSLA